MTIHRVRAQFDRAQWRLDLLFPLWALQLMLAMTMTGLFAWRLGHSLTKHNEDKAPGGTPAVEFVWEAVNMGLSSVAASCTFVDLAKLMAESLTPRAMLLIHTLQLACALAILALDVAVYVLRAEMHYSMVGLGLDAALLLAAATMSIYALVTHRRLLVYDDFSLPANFKSYGFNDKDDYSLASLRRGQTTPEKRPSFASMRGAAASSSASPPPDDAEQVTPGRVSYNHLRDTQFDDYVALHSSRRPGLNNITPSGTASIKTRSRGASYTSVDALVTVSEEETNHLDRSAGPKRPSRPNQRALPKSGRKNEGGL